MATRQPQKHPQYGVDSTGTTVRSMTSRSVEDWREKQMWGLARSDIQRIDFQYPADSSYTLRRVTSSDTASTRDAWVSAGDTLSQSAVSSMLRVLSSPQADGFAETTSPEAFREAVYAIRFRLSDGTQRSLRLRPASNDRQYLAVADDFPYVAELQKDRWDRSVLKGRAALLSGD